MSTLTSDFTKFGIYDYAALKELAGSTPPDLVEGLLGERSLNILVGDSNLGKTPLAVTLGVSVASGRPFLGRKVEKGRVLYFDSETPLPEFPHMLEVISQTAGLTEPPSEFLTFPLNGPESENSSTATGPGEAVLDAVSMAKPSLVIIDPLRTFWPQAQKDAETAMSVLAPLRKATKKEGCTWLLLHHRRKHSAEGTPSLLTDAHGWLQESAGSQALVNHTDTRLGVEPVDGPGDAELVLGGFARSKGRIAPFYLGRERDSKTGEPVGYQPLLGLALLPESYQEAFMALPDKFRFVDALRALGGASSSNAKAFLDRCVSFGLAKRTGKEFVKSME